MPPLVQRIGLRISRALRARLDHAATQGERSLSAEVTRRLKASFSSDGQQSLDLGELPLADEYDQAARVFAGAYDVAKRMGADDAQARHFAGEKARRVTGIDWARELGNVQQDRARPLGKGVGEVVPSPAALSGSSGRRVQSCVQDRVQDRVQGIVQGFERSPNDPGYLPVYKPYGFIYGIGTPGVDAFNASRPELHAPRPVDHPRLRPRRRKNRWGFRGVKWRARAGVFEAWISAHSPGKKIWCGQAKSAEDAARLYDQAARRLYGDKAITNFPTTLSDRHALAQALLLEADEFRAPKFRLVHVPRAVSAASGQLGSAP